MSEEVIQTVLAEIVKKVQIDDGDILIVRTYDDSVLGQLAEEINKMYAEMEETKKFILVEESALDVLRDADEEMMRELGWEKIKND